MRKSQKTAVDKKWLKLGPKPPEAGVRVLDYSSENVGHEEPRYEAWDKQSEIDHDERQVLLRLARRLKERAELDLSRILVKIEDGTVVLAGKVTSEAAKMEICEIAEALPGVREVQDKLEIESL